MARVKYPIYLLSFCDQHTLAATFLRFQEYYESPKFRGRVFGWEEYMDWYAETNGSFTYLKDWSGFNIPDWVLKPFVEGRFDPLTRKEAALLEMFRGRTAPFYIIGAVKGETADMIHEFVHALFYIFPDYRRDVTACLRRSDLGRIKRRLMKMGYARSVLEDEINAYVLTGLVPELEPERKRLQPAARKLRKIFLSHFGRTIGRKDWPKLLATAHRVSFRP